MNFKKITEKINRSTIFFVAIYLLMLILSTISFLSPKSLNCLGYVILGFFLVISILLDYQFVSILLILISPFRNCIDFLNFGNFYVSNLCVYCFVIVFMLKLFIGVFKDNSKFDAVAFLLLVINLLYSFLNTTIERRYSYLFINYLCVMFLFYLLYVNRDKSDKYRTMKYFVLCQTIFMILNLFLYLLPNVRDLLVEDSRFGGLCGNPNAMSIYLLMTIATLMILYVKNNLSGLLFYPVTILFAMMGVLTKSKAFLLLFALILLVYLVWLGFCNKKKFIYNILIIPLLLFVCFCIFKKEFVDLFSRFSNSNHDNFWNSLLTGRVKIWEEYLTRWKSSEFTILFGCGAGAPFVETMSCHNTYIDILYRFGIVGSVIIIIELFLLLSLNKRKSKFSNLIYFLPLVILICIALEESVLATLQMIIFYCVIVAFCTSSQQFKKNRLKFVKLIDAISLLELAIVLIPALVAKIFLRRYWLVAEEKNEARDNGYWFFKYVRENHPNQKIKYVINKRSPDYKKVANLGNIINYGHLQHWFWYIVADKNISSQKGGKPNAAICYLFEVVLGFRKNNRIFLQHGITINNVTFLHYKNTRMRLFITATYPEHKYIQDNFGYPSDYVQLLGFSRFDNLNDEVKDDDIILVMPTWRQWLAKKIEAKQIEGTGAFEKSEYYLKWNNFLNSPELCNLLKQKKKKIWFYPHRNMQQFLSSFNVNNEYIKICDWEHNNIQDVLKRASILITDYSSVFFDFLYMKKPVLFYQFDELEFRKHQYEQGYFDYKNNDITMWANNEETLINNLKKVINHDYNFEQEVNNYFKYTDTNNSKRIFEYIKYLEGEKNDS